LRQALEAIITGLVACFFALAAIPAYAQGTPPKEPGKSVVLKPLALQKLGVREFDVGRKGCKIPWYRVDVDYNEIISGRKDFVRVVKPDGSVTAYRPPSWWDRVVAPEGTVTTHVGRYGPIRLFSNHAGVHADWTTWGVDFRLGDRHPVKPGKGKVHVAWWLFTEKPRDDGMMFEEDRYYVFCLDRQPVERGKNLGGEPACQMSDELDHLIGIIEVRPTFHYATYPRSEALFLTPETLRSFRDFRLNGLTKKYELDYGVVRGEAGRLWFVGPEEQRVAAKAETLQKLLYAVNTCSWRKHDREHKYEISPRVAQWEIEYVDAEGKRKRVAIGYDEGGWHLVGPGPTYYSTYYPRLLYDVETEIEAACKAGSKKAEND